MKLKINTIALVIFILVNIKSYSQENYKKDIIGTWKIKKIEYEESYDSQTELQKESKNISVVFNEDGTFLNKVNNIITVEGVYNFSEDGKVLNQTRNENSEGQDLPLNIELLNKSELILKVEDYIKLFLIKIK